MKAKMFIPLFLLLGLITSSSYAQTWGRGWGIAGRSSWVNATADTFFLDRANQDISLTRSAANTLKITATTWLPAVNAPTIGSDFIGGELALGETWWDVSGSGTMKWDNVDDRFEHDNSTGRLGMVAGGVEGTKFYLYGIDHANAGQFILDAGRAHFRPDSSSSLTYIFVIEDTTGQAADDLDTALVVYPNGGVLVGNPAGVTGGNKGAGTINANAVYDDNTILTGDFVFEDDYMEGMNSIKEMESFYVKNKHLPTLTSKTKLIEMENMPLGQRLNEAIVTIENMAIYIADLQKQIDELKARGLK